MNGLSLAYIIGWGFALFSLMVIPSLGVALAYNEQSEFAVFLSLGLITAFSGGGLIIALNGKSKELSRREKITLIIAAWVIYSLLAAIPFEASGVIKSRLDAIFEATSAVTTTGATVLQELILIPKSIILWRSFMQWVGGFLTLFTLCFAFIPFFSADHTHQDFEKSASKTGNDYNNLLSTLRLISPIYLILTAACFILLLLTQIPLFDALCLSLSTISTGGFMPRDGAFSTYGSISAMIVLSVFMVLGAISIIWLSAVFKRDINGIKNTRDPIWVLGVVLFLGIIIIALKSKFNEGTEFLGLGRETATAIMDATSLISTTGYIASPFSFERLSPSLILFALVIGGGALSTAGGIKFSRLTIMFHQSIRELRSLIYPNAVRPRYLGDEPKERQFITTVWVIFCVTIVVVVMTTMMLSFFGLGLEAALFASLSALSNCGPCYEQVRLTHIHDAIPFIDMAKPSKIILIATMIIGRLEIIVAVCLLNITFWRH